MGVDKDREGKRHQAKLQQRCGPCHVHQCPALRRRPDKRHRALHRRHEQRQHKREMADLHEHLTPSTGAWPRQLSVASRGSARFTDRILA